MKNAFYTCPYCNTEYENPVDLAHCILSCEQKKRHEEEEIKKKKLEAEKEARYKEIEEEGKKLADMIAQYSKDYGSFSFKHNPGLDFPYIWKMFL